MPRGKQWTAIEKQNAARAYVLATKNPINGTDQKLTSFTKSIHNKLREIQPIGVLDKDRLQKVQQKQYTIFFVINCFLMFQNFLHH
jgi:hypothetical protein